MIRQSDTICVWGDSQGITIISNLPHKHDKVQIAQSGLRKPIIWQQIEFWLFTEEIKIELSGLLLLPLYLADQLYF